MKVNSPIILLLRESLVSYFLEKKALCNTCMAAKSLFCLHCILPNADALNVCCTHSIKVLKTSVCKYCKTPSLCRDNSNKCNYVTVFIGVL